MEVDTRVNLLPCEADRFVRAGWSLVRIGLKDHDKTKPRVYWVFKKGRHTT